MYDLFWNKRVPFSGKKNNSSRNLEETSGSRKVVVFMTVLIYLICLTTWMTGSKHNSSEKYAKKK